MALDRTAIDRWIVGEAWVGSELEAHLEELCDRIGPRVSASEDERRAAGYIRDRMAGYGLEGPRLEEFEFDAWEHKPVEARVLENDIAIDALPFMCCPPTDVTGPLVDVGFGTPHRLDAARKQLPGAVAVVNLTLEPFTDPVTLPTRLKALAAAGAAAAVVVERKTGRRMEYHSANDFREGPITGHPLPTVVTSREHGALLRRLATGDRSLSLKVESRACRGTGVNTVADIEGDAWPEESIVVSAHHDTVFNSPGGNDNASGTVVVMEVARVLAALQRETGAKPGCALRFVTFGAEELTLQGSMAYVDRHHGPEPLPRFCLNADELATAPVSGIALLFPHLRALMQGQLDAMGDGLRCQVMPEPDPTTDSFSFALRGIPAAILWRWRFIGRHPDSDFHHEPGDTTDKVRPRELKEYVAFMARLVHRLSHVPPQEWPDNPLRAEHIRAEAAARAGTFIRTM